MSAAIRAEGLSKSYQIGAQAAGYQTFRESISAWARKPWRRSSQDESVWALEDVSFELSEGGTLGIIGANGAGKSTLLKVLSRITSPTSGFVEMRGRVGSLLEVGTGFHPELTGRENIYLNGAILGMSQRNVKSKFEEIVEFAEVERFIDTPVKRYSSGMYLRLAFSVASHLEPDVLIIDEVLAVGDARFQAKCLGRMGEVARTGRTVLFVSHNLAAVTHLCEQGLFLEGGRVKHFGSATDAAEAYVQSFSTQGSGSREGHVIFSNKDESFGVRLARVEVLDGEGRPKPVVSTWDEIVLRFTIEAEGDVDNAAVEFSVSTPQGLRVFRLSTRPDMDISWNLKKGPQVVDCHIPSLPLAEGMYLIEGAVTIPNVKYLWRKEGMGSLRVHGKNVYGSTIAPSAKRSLIAFPHGWDTAPQHRPPRRSHEP